MTTTATIIVLSVAMIALIGVMVTLAYLGQRARQAAPYVIEIEAAEARLRVLREEIESARRQLADERRNVDEAARRAAEVASLSEQADSLRAELTNLGAQRGELDEIERQRADLVLRHEAVSRQVREAEAELAVTQDRIREAEMAQHRLEDLGRQVEELTRRRESLEREAADLRALVAERDRLQQSIEDAKERIGRLDASAEAETARAEEAREARRQAQSALDEAQAALVRTRDELAAERSDLSARRQDVAAATEALSDLQVRRAQLAADVERLRSEIGSEQEKVGREIDGLAARKDRLEQEVEELRDEVAAERAELSAQRRAASEAADDVSAALARKAQIESELDRLRGQGSGAAEGVDGLADLKRPPGLLQELYKDEWTGPRGEILQEAEALHRAGEHLRGAGLVYPDRVVKAFHTALKVNDHTQMTVLAGISGTGKSQLPRHYAEAMGIGFLPVPVQPRWDSPQDLMGFYNYIEGRYRATDLARCMWWMDRYRDGADSVLGERMLLVLLDEMNLARVEYYFSDFLSRLETRPSRAEEQRLEARRDAEIVLDVPQATGGARIFPGRNILFAGTMNEDESTQSLSDKVVDRANLLRFASPTGAAPRTRGERHPAPAPLSRDRWNKWHRVAADLPSAYRDEAARLVEELARRMAAAGRPIGHRLRAAILEYVANYPIHDGQQLDVRVPLADQLEMRLLPKLRGVETGAHEDQLDDVAEFAETDLGDMALSEAIRDSLERSRALAQFAWHGLTRT